ncbi:MAG: hypothetical protein COW04_00950, partial [Deltaproteobacteria bacterium CG12_big_fil_rev_8_21_14_0_65_43_10]
MELYKRLLQFVKPYWFRLSGAMICMVFVSAFTAGVAFLIKPALDELFFKRDLIAPVLFPLSINEISMLHLIPLAVILLYFMKGAFDYGQSYLMGYVGQGVVTDIRNKLYSKIQ